MLRSLSRQAESRQVIHHEVRYDVNRPLKSQARKKLHRILFLWWRREVVTPSFNPPRWQTTSCQQCRLLTLLWDSLYTWCRNSSAGIVTYRLRAERKGEFSLIQSVQTVLVPGTEDSLPGCRAREAWSSPRTYIKNSWSYSYTTCRLYLACTYRKIYYGANSASSVHNRTESLAIACRMSRLFPSSFRLSSANAVLSFWKLMARHVHNIQSAGHADWAGKRDV